MESYEITKEEFDEFEEWREKCKTLQKLLIHSENRVKELEGIVNRQAMNIVAINKGQYGICASAIDWDGIDMLDGRPVLSIEQLEGVKDLYDILYLSGAGWMKQLDKGRKI